MKENGGWFIQFMTRTEMYWRKLLIKYNFILEETQLQISVAVFLFDTIQIICTNF